MGAGSSSLNFPGRHEYSKWDLATLSSAIKRWEAAVGRRMDGSHPVDVTKREFWEIFTDYETVVDGEFLSLPVEHFDKYVRGKGRVFIVEPFAMVALFCDDALDDKFKLLFELFDYTKKGHLGSVDLVVLIQAVTSGAFGLGLTEREPTMKELEAIAEDMFRRADTNMDEEISMEEFFDWAHTNVETQGLLRQFSVVKRDALEERIQFNAARKTVAERVRSTIRKASLVTALAGKKEHKDPEALKRAQDALIKLGKDGAAALESAEAAGGKGGSGLFTAKGGRRRSSVDIMPTGHMATLASVEAVRKQEDDFEPETLATIKTQARQTRRTKMRTICTRRVMSDLVGATEFDMAELTSLAHRFVDASHVTGHLPMETFAQVIKDHFPRIHDAGLLERLFAVMDEDSDGLVDFREFVVGLSKLLRGTAIDKMQLVFEIYDTSGDGDICIVELIYLVKQGTEALQDIIEFSEDVMNSLDADGNGDVDVDEFVESLTRDPGLLDAFTQSTSISRGVARSLHKLRSVNPNFNKDKLMALWEGKYATDRTQLVKPLNIKSYVKFMQDHFECTEEHEGKVADVWASFDPMETGTVQCRDLLTGFGQIFLSSLSDKAAFLFQMYDMDGSGSLDKNEILHMLLSTQERTNANAGRVIKLLQALDVDGDGRITMDEFLETAVKQPLMMDAMERLFASRGEVYDVLSQFAVEKAGAHKPKGRRMRYGHKGGVGSLVARTKPDFVPERRRSSAAVVAAQARRESTSAAAGAGAAGGRRGSAARRKSDVRADLKPLEMAGAAHASAAEQLAKMDALLGDKR